MVGGMPQILIFRFQGLEFACSFGEEFPTSLLYSSWFCTSEKKRALSTVTLLCCLKCTLSSYKFLSLQSWAAPWQPFFRECPGDQATLKLFLSPSYSHWFKDGVSSCWLSSAHHTEAMTMNDGLSYPELNMTEVKHRQKRLLFPVSWLEHVTTAWW